MEKIHWTQLPGNKYLKKLEPKMLTPSGCTILQEIKLIGNKNKQCVRVIYDSQYVFHCLKNNFIEPLKLNSPTDLVNLLEDIKHG